MAGVRDNMTNKPKQQIVSAGRKDLFKPEMCDIARGMALLGATDKQIREQLGISQKQFSEWKRRRPELAQALADGRDIADAKVAESLYHRALGYFHPETKIVVVKGKPQRITITKHHPPDTQAASLWLRNRQPDKWRDSKEISGKLTLDTVLQELEEGDGG